MNSCLSLAGEGSCVVLPRSDYGEMGRPRVGTFSYALRPLRGEGGHLDLHLVLVVVGEGVGDGGLLVLRQRLKLVLLHFSECIAK